MKKNILFTYLFVLAAHCFGQVPYSFNYQGVARDANGEELRNQSITVSIAISGSGGSYNQSQQTTTNEFGVFTVAVGSGDALKGIKWEEGNMQMSVTVTSASGTVSGGSQIHSVPYAIMAGMAAAMTEDAEIPLGAIDGDGASVGQVLTWDGTRWAPADPEYGPGGEANPIGPAGGDLTGTYPDPLIAPGVVNNAKLADDAVGTSNIMDGAVTAAKLNQSGASGGQVLKWLTNSWVPADDETGDGTPSGAAGGDLGGSYPNPSVVRLQGRSVSTATPASGQVLKWLGGNWVPADDETGDGTPSGAAGGDLGGSYPNPSVVRLQGRSVSSATPSVDQVLRWDGNSWSPANVTSGGGTPSGAAGGDLGGSYPNPSVVRLQGRSVSTATPANGQILRWNGSAWAPSEDQTGDGLTLPYEGSTSASQTAFKIIHSNGRNYAIEAENTGVAARFARSGVAGEFTGNVFINGILSASDYININSGSNNSRLNLNNGSNTWAMQNAGALSFIYNNETIVAATRTSANVGGVIVQTASFRPGTDNFASLGTSALRWRIVYAANGTINTSDARLKNNISAMPYGLHTVSRLNPVTYQWKDNPEDGRKLGFLAQEVEKVIPEVVHVGDDGRYGMNYPELIPVLVKAIQELTEKVDHLEGILLRAGISER